MKWFKHETDAHTNLKLQAVLDKFGLEAFGYYWICIELVGLQSDNFKLKTEKNWKNYIKKFVGIEIERQETFLEYFAEINLIDKKALKLGILYIPKMEDRSDNYTKSVRRKYEDTTKNVSLEENRKEENRKEENNTPAQEARTFFEGEFEPVLKEFIEKTHSPPELLHNEFSKFILYWTEKNKSGTKQKWELQKTFEIRRRLATWLGNVRQFSKVEFSKGRGLA